MITRNLHSATGSPTTADSSRPRQRVVAIMAVVILVPSMLGFANKFRELVHVLQGDASGAFALAPIMNYILASVGFLFMLGWAAKNGMFRDIEAPKKNMLDMEHRLDAQDSHCAAHWSDQ